jgi:hypothetical protein
MMPPSKLEVMPRLKLERDLRPNFGVQLRPVES